MTAGTVFEGSKLPLRVWFRAMWWVTNQKNGVSALGLQRLLGFGSYKTAWTLLHKLRRAKEDRYPGRYLDKVIVVIAVEVRGEGIGRIRLQQVREPTQEILLPLVKKVAAPGSKILIDGWWGYHGLDKMGFSHRRDVTDGKGREVHDFVMPRVHRGAALLKRWLLGTHQGRVAREQRDYCLDEFAFRFDRRTSTTRGQLFQRLLEQAVAIEHSTYGDLVKCS